MKSKRPTEQERARLHADLMREKKQRESGYRARALAMFPHVCGSCGREFEGARLKELTVHHKNHDHNHNPPDGSNWELLCIYCHDHEHEKYHMKGRGGSDDDEAPPPDYFNPFGGLDSLIKPSDSET